jgi:flagellar biogenesis protein FliO
VGGQLEASCLAQAKLQAQALATLATDRLQQAESLASSRHRWQTGRDLVLVLVLVLVRAWLLVRVTTVLAD